MTMKISKLSLRWYIYHSDKFGIQEEDIDFTGVIFLDQKMYK